MFTLETLQKKINQIENKNILDQLDRANERAVKYGYRSLTYDPAVNAYDRMLDSDLSVKWAPRLKMFKDYNGKLTFDILKGVGHSYRWYEIVKKFGDVWVLNTYNYSRQTSQHVRSLHSLLKQLGIKFVCIEAPSGLQKLADAEYHVMHRIAEMRVKIKHGRKNSGEFLRSVANLKNFEKQLKTIQQLKLIDIKTEIDETIKELEEKRLKKLVKAKEERRKAKMPKPQFTVVVPPR